MNLKFRKLDQKLIYEIFNDDAHFISGDMDEYLRTTIFLKSSFKEFWKNRITKLTLKHFYRDFLIYGEDMPKLFLKNELGNDGFDYLDIANKLGDEHYIKDLFNLDCMNLYIVYTNNINEALIIDQKEFKILGGELDEK